MSVTPASAPAVQGPSHADALPAGTRLGEFELEGLLGVGGFGLVYRAFDRSLQRPVAIKEFLPGTLVARGQGATVSLRSPTQSAAFQRGLQGFLGEARLLASFDHPSLVKVYRFWEANGTAYMAMPLYQGMTLQQARAQMHGPPPEAWLRQVIAAMLGALQCLHAHQTLHRDVAPDNIFLQDIGPPVLLDLGAARRALADRGHQHTAILKVHYAPIEQYADVDADTEDMQPGPWSDLYSLGAVVYDCLCGQAPLPATFRVIKDRLQPLPEVARVLAAEFGRTYSVRFLEALSQALEIRPERRPPDTQTLAERMGLGPEPNLSRFDWRAELGPVWLPAQAQVDAPPRTAPEAPTLQLTPSAPPAADPGRAARPMRPSADLDLSDPPALGGPPARPEPGADAGGGWRHALLAGLLGLGLLGAGAWWWQARTAPAVSAPDMLTEARGAAPGPASDAPPAPAGARPAAPEAGAQAPVSTPAAVPPTPAAPASALSARAAPGPTRSEPHAPRTPPSALASTPAPARALRERPAPAEPSTAGAQGALASKEHQDGANLCADVGWLRRTLCMHRECAKPQNASTTACVDYRRGMQERARRPDTL